MSELITRFDASVQDLWEPLPAPTTESISIIEAHFGCKLPALLLRFAYESRSFSSFFLGLGPDVDSHTHIIHKNNCVRSDSDWLKRAPGPRSSLVLITENFMGNFFWCLETSEVAHEHPIVFWSADAKEQSSERYSSFERFIQAIVEFYEGKPADSHFMHGTP